MMADLQHKDNQFLVMSDSTGISGFLMFRYQTKLELEYLKYKPRFVLGLGKVFLFTRLLFLDVKDAAIAYCLELQVKSGKQKKGIGRYLTRALEAIAKRANMESIMLTVYHSNVIAVKAYRSYGYPLVSFNFKLFLGLPTMPYPLFMHFQV
jgi:ribosomal protein S18 acetylase RimI-like enzyme